MYNSQLIKFEIHQFNNWNKIIINKLKNSYLYQFTFQDLEEIRQYFLLSYNKHQLEYRMYTAMLKIYLLNCKK